jgi:hypothetical protein
MSNTHRLCTLIVCLLATAAIHAQVPSASALPSAPQPHTGSINGTVTDTNDDPVPHTIVILDGPGPGLSDQDHRVTTADANGFFELNDLGPGTYRISVSAKGFADYTSAAIDLKPAQNLDLPDIALQISGTTTTVNVSYSQQQIATEQVSVEETQRVLGIIPNYYAVYVWNAAPIAPKQKFSLAWKTFIDPTTTVAVAAVAGVEQGLDTFPAWGQDWPGYGQRFGAAYADNFTNNMFTGALYPILLHQDPRYYYMGPDRGTTMHRILYAISTVAICKGDNGRWQPNYSSVLGTFTASAISNAYYPAAQRGVMLTIDNSLVNLASGAFGALVQEFLLKRLTPAARHQ